MSKESKILVTKSARGVSSMSFFYPTGTQLFSESVFSAQPTRKDGGPEHMWPQREGRERADM